MKPSRLFFGAVLAAFSLSTFAQPSAPAELPKCEKPIASVMVGKLACKSASCGGGTTNPQNGLAAMLAMAQAAQSGGMPANVTGIADGIKDVLVTALTSTGCFDVQDREQMAEIAEELRMAGKTVQTQQADFLISGAVTQIDVSQENKSIGGGLLSALTNNPLVGAIAGNVGFKTQKAAVALDMKLVDVNTAKVVASKRAEVSSETSSFSMGAAAGALGGAGIAGFGGAMSSLKGTNLEAVTKDAISQSVTFLVEAARAARSTAPTQVTSASN